MCLHWGLSAVQHCFELKVGVFLQLAGVDKAGLAVRSVEACCEGGEGTFFGPAKAALAKKPRQGDEVGVDATYDVVALKSLAAKTGFDSIIKLPGNYSMFLG